MKKNKIFIITSTIDYPVNHVIQEINKLGYDTARFDIDNILLDSDYCFELSNKNSNVKFNQSGINLFKNEDYLNFHSIWDTGTLPIGEIIHGTAGNLNFENDSVIKYLKVEYDRFINSFLGLFNHNFWVNYHADAVIAENKIANLKLAKKLGLKIPKTIISNSKNAIKRFLNTIENDAIIKSFTFFEFIDNNQLNVCFARKKSKQEILQNLNIIYYPLFLQEYIDKNLELRIVVVGNDIFSVAIHSQESEVTKEDWRVSDVSKLRHEVYQLPEHVKKGLLNFCKTRKLVFAAFDFILDKDGELVFLECNPKGEWYWLEEETGIPLAKSIANLLVKRN